MYTRRTVYDEAADPRFLLKFCVSGLVQVECTEAMYFDNPEIQNSGEIRDLAVVAWASISISEHRGLRNTNNTTVARKMCNIDSVRRTVISISILLLTREVYVESMKT